MSLSQSLQNYVRWPQLETELDERSPSQCRLLYFLWNLRYRDKLCRLYCFCNPHLQSLVRFLINDKRDWTRESFVMDQVVDLLTCSSCQCEGIGVSKRRRLTKVGASVCHLPNLESICFWGSLEWWVLYCSMVEIRRITLDTICIVILW